MAWCLVKHRDNFNFALGNILPPEAIEVNFLDDNISIRRASEVVCILPQCHLHFQTSISLPGVMPRQPEPFPSPGVT